MHINLSKLISDISKLKVIDTVDTPILKRITLQYAYQALVVITKFKKGSQKLLLNFNNCLIATSC